MANLQERRNKEGKLISYSIRVFRGRGADGNQLKPFTTTFAVEPTWSEKTARKKAEAYAATFEEKCKLGFDADNRQTFEEYCEYVLRTKETSKGIKHSTLVRYRDLTRKIYPEIGYFKLKDIRPQHLNDFYSKLSKDGRIMVTATAKEGLRKVVENRELGEDAAEELINSVTSGKRLSNVLLGRAAKISASTVSQMLAGKAVKQEKAKALAEALGYSLKTLFTISEKRKPYEAKTILEYHQLISSVLSMAEEEMLVPYNAAEKAKPPKVVPKEANFYDPVTVKRIKDAFDKEPVKWRMLGYMLVYTGGRRGEVLGLKWEHVDFEGNKVRIVNNSLYSADIGIYEDTPKTRKSERWIGIPATVMEKLREYKIWQDGEAARLEGYWTKTGYLFTKDNGEPMHPDSVNDRLKKISEKYGLPHLNPHAFRHSYVSALIFAGVDPVAISGAAGHSNPTTTTNIYAHLFDEAKKRNAEIIESVYD